MYVPTKKLSNGFELPVLGFGTWGMGGLMTKDASHDKEDIQAIKNAIDAGITHIDTAELYAEGHAEELVGEAIKGLERKKLFITTKVKDHLGKEDVIDSIKKSLKRLGLEYVDLYLVHAPNPDIPISETMEAFDELVQSGLVKHIGVSNFSVEQLKEAQKFTINPIVTNQIHYNVTYQESERIEIVKYCQKEDILVTTYRPVERGALTKTGEKRIDEMCEKYDKTPSQIAIKWLISQPNIVTLSKMGNMKHLEENLGAIGWEMEKEDIDRLRNGLRTTSPKKMIKLNR